MSEQAHDWHVLRISDWDGAKQQLKVGVSSRLWLEGECEPVAGLEQR
jgi:hypothetical protein